MNNSTRYHFSTKVEVETFVKHGKRQKNEGEDTCGLGIYKI